MSGRGIGGGGIAFLGGGAIAGIVVGSVFGAFILAAIVYWFIARPILAKRREKVGGQVSGGYKYPSFYDGRKPWAMKGKQWPSFYDRGRMDRSAGIEEAGAARRTEGGDPGGVKEGRYMPYQG